MSKFKVGDKIIRVADEYPQYGMYIGKVYTVKEVEDGFQESISVEEIPDKYWLEDYFELHYELIEQSTQECPYDTIDELEAQVENLEELVSDQAHQINQLTEALDYFKNEYSRQYNQAQCYFRLHDLLQKHESFQKSGKCRSDELADTIEVLQDAYDRLPNRFR